jgi:hypothetical protein
MQANQKDVLVIRKAGSKTYWHCCGTAFVNWDNFVNVSRMPEEGRDYAAVSAADFQAWASASLARYSGRPPCRATSRLAVDAARSRSLAISRIDEPEAIPREMSSRSGGVSARSERRRTAGTTHREATPHSEWTNDSCRTHAQSHAATVPPSSGTTSRSDAPQKAQTVYLASYNTTLKRRFRPDSVASAGRAGSANCTNGFQTSGKPTAQPVGH